MQAPSQLPRACEVHLASLDSNPTASSAHRKVNPDHWYWLAAGLSAVASVASPQASAAATDEAPHLGLGAGGWEAHASALTVCMSPCMRCTWLRCAPGLLQRCFWGSGICTAAALLLHCNSRGAACLGLGMTLLMSALPARLLPVQSPHSYRCTCVQAGGRAKGDWLAGA